MLFMGEYDPETGSPVITGSGIYWIGNLLDNIQIYFYGRDDKIYLHDKKRSVT